MPAARGAALVVAALLLLGGCGQDKADLTAKAKPTAKPDKDTSTCRASWSDLGKEVEGKEGRTEPSALAARWNAVSATIDYYATSATDKDCGDRLDGQKAAIAALSGFEAKLRPYDVPYRLAQVQTAATAYAAKPAPPKTRKKLTRKQKAALPPKPAEVGAALKTLTAQSLTATQQQAPAWEQARVVELTDTAAVTKAVKDLKFLSSESAAYRACSQAFATVRRALAATR